MTSKCFLINFCHKKRIPIIVSTGSGGRIDPTKIEIVDIAKTIEDPLARSVRKILKEQYGFVFRKFGIKAVVSREIPLKPVATDNEIV